MSDIVQWVLGGLAIAGYVVLWRIDANTRAAKRLQQASRRAVAEQKVAVARLQQYANDWGHLNQKRAAMNDRYDDTLTKIRETFNIKDPA